jgi:hypothetical protein
MVTPGGVSGDLKPKEAPSAFEIASQFYRFILLIILNSAADIWFGPSAEQFQKWDSW